MATTAPLLPTHVPMLSSSTGLLAMLEEDELEVKGHALAKLNLVVADFWAESETSAPERISRSRLNHM